MAKILLTGAAGFIGYHVYKKLASDYEVVAIDNLSTFSNYDIKLDRLADLTGAEIAWDTDHRLKDSTHAFYRIDISDSQQLAAFFSEHAFDAVIHLAAMTGVRQSVSTPGIYEQANVQGFENILRCCHQQGIARLIYASSSSVYGGDTPSPFREDAPIDTPLNYYAVTKHANEIAAEGYCTRQDMQAIGLRFFTVYGPWTRPDMATYTFIKNIMEDRAVTLFNNGNMERDFTYVGDIVESIARVLDKLLTTPTAAGSHQIYNIGEGKPVNLKDYIAVIERKLNKKAVIQNAPMNKEEMISTFADCSRLFDFIGYKPETTVEQGLEQTVAWFLNYQGRTK